MSDINDKRLIVRYSPGQRVNHWIVAICFVLLALSGLALFHPAFYWLTALFGGGQWTRILHPWVGVVMFVAFFIFAATMWRTNLMDRRDWQWIRQSGDVVRKREDRVPESGRYNGGQKLLYFLQIFLLLGLLITGILMWREYFWGFLTIGTIRVASLLHAIFAFLMICAIIIHIYAGLWVKGSIRAMTRGTVTPGWAWKHHRQWWRSLRGERRHTTIDP
ncbi:MAG TPA: formate dehydrogenase subunit gamma [Burkholderiaceae bacterium]|nr:formate dehydrogenase subunit gamma [Burkholderiaceae bacterium]